MNRPVASLGVLLAMLGVFLFYGVFVGLTPGFFAMMVALVTVPLGSGLAFYGAAFRGAYAVEPRAMGGGGRAASGTVWAAIAVAVVAILLAIGSLSIAFSAQASANSASTQAAQANNGLSALNGTLANAGIAPTTVAFKVDWCNTDNAVQDRFCPNELIANQGDLVQIMFIHNDTDVHTFTMSGAYSFQINDSETMMHNFLNNLSLNGPCLNSGTYAQESATTSGVYCVSGLSLLPPSSSSAPDIFRIAQNPTPASPGGPGGLNLQEVPVDNMVHVVQFNFTAAVSEVWGIGAFQVSTPGIYEFFCHYHVSNGMFGYLIVLPNAYCNTHAAACGVRSA